MPKLKLFILMLLCLVLSGASCAADDINTEGGVAGPMNSKDSLENCIQKALELNDPHFNSEISLLGGFKNPHHYHTTLPVGADVHKTRESLVYALACLDSGEGWRVERALDIIDAVLELQDKDPNSPTCGVWPWYYEEPLSKMNPPDYNWADFIGVQLLLIAQNHQDKLPAEFQERIKEAVILAAEAIVKRNVPPSYTNIAIMGSYVTAIAGQFYNVDTLSTYGKDRIRRFYDFTMQAGGFPEYNSPTYTVVALNELARLLHDLKDPESLKLVKELHDMLWSDIANHYHSPTRQWAGPHSRAYSTFLGAGTYAFLSCSLPDEVFEDTLSNGYLSKDDLHVYMDALHAPSKCPEQFFDLFGDITNPRNHVQVMAKGNPDVVGYTRLTPTYALSSINHSIMWDQRRNIVGYWKNSASENPSALHLRFLHDGHDFSSANVVSAQCDGAVLAGINIATNGGDRHCVLDILKDGKVEASDLRLRLHLYNIPESIGLPQLVVGKATILDLGEVNLMVRVEKAKCSLCQPFFEVSRSGRDVYLDLVFYKGPKKEIDLTQVDEAHIVMALALWDESELAPESDSIDIAPVDNYLRAQWIPYAKKTLSIYLHTRPTTYGEIVEAVRQQQ